MTERQRDKATKRQRYIETSRQRDRDTKRVRETEKQRDIYRKTERKDRHLVSKTNIHRHIYINEQGEKDRQRKIYR